MFSFLKKKPGEYPSESEWSLLQGEKNGRPVFVRRNNSAKQLASNSEFSHRVGVAIPLLRPNPAGLPSSEEMESLNQIEDELSLWLEKEQACIMVLSITTDGMREFVFYTRAPQTIENAINNVRSKFSSYELQFYVAEDQKWSLYRQFT